MIVVGLILAILYSRMVQESVYGYFDQLEKLPVFMTKLEALVRLPEGSTMQFYKSTIAIVILGVVPALIVIGCMLFKFFVEAGNEERRAKKRRQKVLAAERQQSAGV